MRRITAGICLVAGVISTGVPPALSEDALQAQSALVDQTTLPDAIELKGSRLTQTHPLFLQQTFCRHLLSRCCAPQPGSPDVPSQVRIHELRPLTYEETLQLAESTARP